ncbi:2207_t:CDS:2 [Acaulospora morrowiae]|uniref:2207_t:CDS:1 n=1 Tax=Acaulospora morrowiae TaxID=94023 RepID=A0A9N9H660_9GLOM|nr:2207_t:CDS:2 [Acaulospora morrowiae]
MTGNGAPTSEVQFLKSDDTEMPSTPKILAMNSENVEALSDKMRVKEPKSSERNVNAIEAVKEPGKDGKLVTLDQAKECYYEKKRNDHQEDELRSTWYETAPASKKYNDKMRKSQRDLVVTEIHLERGECNKETELMERDCENGLDSRDKIVSINTIEPIKKKEGLKFDNRTWKNHYNTIQPISREPDGYCNNNDNTIFAKHDVRNKVVMVLTGDIIIGSCDDLGGPSEETNGGLIIGNGKYGDAHKLTVKRSDANGVRLGYRNDEEMVTNDPPDRNKVE